MAITVREPLVSLPDDHQRLFGSDMWEDIADLQKAEGSADMKMLGAGFDLAARIVWLMVTDGFAKIEDFAEWKRKVRTTEVIKAFHEVMKFYTVSEKTDDESPLED